MGKLRIKNSGFVSLLVGANASHAFKIFDFNKEPFVFVKRGKEAQTGS